MLTRRWRVNSHIFLQICITIKFHTIFLFLLPLCLVFLGAGCDDEGLSLKHSINGSWKVSKQVISGELEGIVAPPENALYFDISIVIPNTTS